MFRNKLSALLILLAGLAFDTPANAVNCFWVGGTATWDGSNFTSWSTTTGGAGAGCPGATNVPGTGDVAIFDGLSGGGTVTVNATISISAMTTSAFTGTLDFSANNNNINIGTVTAAGGWVDAGSGTHTVNMGGGAWTIDATAAIINFSGANMTLAANSSTVSFVSRANVTRTFSGNAKTFNSVTINGGASHVVNLNGINTFASLTIVGQAIVSLGANQTVTTLAVTSSASLPVSIRSQNVATQRTITLTNNFTPAYASFQDIVFSGGTNAATNSFDFGNNSGITITGPTSGGGRCIGC